MSHKLRTTIVFALILLLLVQTLTACGKDSAGVILDDDVSANLIQEELTTENVIQEQVTTENKITENFVRENITYENGIYECIIDENTVCETYIIEIKVGETTEDEIAAQLPEYFDDFDIDWKSVIGKFAVGTTIIVAVGVVGIATKGTSYFIFGTPTGVAKDAFILGVTAAATNIAIGSAKDGRMSKKATKYAVEGFADGYMWGAITSVLKTPAKNVLMKKGLKLASGETLKVRMNSTVVSESGEKLGYIRYCKDRIYLVEGKYANAKILREFSVKGEELVGKRALTYGKNAIISSNGKVKNYTFTDENGVPYKERLGLLKKVQYTLNKYKYTTDKRGRLLEAEATELRLKPEGAPDRPSLQGIRVPGLKANDNKSHVFADMFDGKSDIGNLVAMSEKVNKGEYKKLENLWLKELKKGSKVHVKIRFIYKGRSARPSKIKVTYWINGEKTTKVIENAVLKGDYYDEIKYVA